MSLNFIKSIDFRKNKNLVIVRSGLSSLHGQYFYDNSIPREWDRMILSYVDPVVRDIDECDFVVEGGLSKWTDFNDLLDMGFFSKYDYDYIMLADDDVVPFDLNSVNILFDRAKMFNLEICQPALTHDSYYSWVITLQSPAFHMRYTNFVECMCPVFSKNSLDIIKPVIATAVSGYGVDIIFSELFSLEKKPMRIVDDSIFRHVKPIDPLGGEFYKHLQKNGVDVNKELSHFTGLFKLKNKDIVTVGGVVRSQTLSF